jgi:hypothetical protein
MTETPQEPLDEDAVEAPTIAAENEHPDDVEGPGDEDYEGELSAASPGSDDDMPEADVDEEDWPAVDDTGDHTSEES